MSAVIKPFKDWTKKAALRLIRAAPVKPIERWDIKVGDLVHIRAGRSAGAQGRVKEVLRDKNRVLVENANLVKRHVRATATAPGGVLAKESPVHYSNVALVDPQTGCVGRRGRARAALPPPRPPSLSRAQPRLTTPTRAPARARTHPLAASPRASRACAAPKACSASPSALARPFP
jgi:large subunit ribosomal protein L24